MIINYKINQIDYRYEYDYDELGNIVKILHKQNGVIVYEVEYQYDNLNQLKREDITINKTGFNISYFNEYQYDKHGNITSISTNKSGVTETINFNYNQIWFDKLNSYDIIKNGVTTKSVSYTYDGQGNPTSITNFIYNDIIYDKATLEWDGRQLKKINIIDDGQIIYSIEYKYNDAGYRIRKAITKYEYQYFVQDEVIYNDGIINGTALVPNTQNLFNYYDEVTVYIAGFGYHTFTSYGDLYIENYSFLGDLYLEVFPSGIYIYSPHSVWKVTGKILEVNVTETSTSTNYTLSNGKVIQETDGTYLIIYTYDYDGTLISFYYDNNINDSINGQEYFYIKNQQGDIIAIVNQYGQIIVEYIYDAWGNIIYVTKNEIARINPYTYRGYRYEWETGWYYLNSRYYNPEIGRFINADGLIGETGDILGHNMYAYCKNNPVMMVDPSGYAPEWWEWAISGALIVGGIALCATGVGSGFGAGLIVAGGSMLSSNIMSAAGLDSKLALQIQSGLQVVAGTGLMFVPGAQALGASLIGGGMLSFAGGYVSESLGGSYALGWTIGNVIGSIVGGGIYQATRYSSGTAQAPMTGRANGRYTQITPNGKNVAYYNGRGQQVLRIDRSHTHFIKGIGDVQPHKHVISWWKYGGQWRWNGPTGNVYPF